MTIPGIVFPIRSRELRRYAARNDVCPECGGPLDTGFECNTCQYDAKMDATPAGRAALYPTERE